MTSPRDDGVSIHMSATAPRTDRPAPPPVIDLDGMPVHAVTEAECVARILAALDAGRGGYVVTPNLDHLRRFHRDAEYRRLAASADLTVADGVPLLWAAKLAGTPLPGRVAGSDLIDSLSAAAARAGRSLYLLGGETGCADEAAGVLTGRYPGLRIAGTHCPAVGFESDPAAMSAIADRLAAARPDVVYVALGSPKQERLIAALRDRLPGAWWLGVGISFSFVAGRVARAPVWMQRTGLEWLHRLTREPRRLAKRYLVEGLPFAAGLAVRCLLRRLRVLRPARSAAPAAPASGPCPTGATASADRVFGSH